MVHRGAKFTFVCIGIYVAYVLLVFFILPFLLPDPVEYQRESVTLATRQWGNLTNFTLEAGGAPVRSVLVTFKNSGATNLLNILTRYPGAYHHYAPFIYYKKTMRNEDDAQNALKRIEELFYCNYQSSNLMLYAGLKYNSFKKFYGRMSHMCALYSMQVCWSPEILSKICKLYPFINMSIYHLRLKYVAELLERQG